MRNGLKKSVQVILSIVVILVLLMWVLWKTVPRWLPSVAGHWLPEGTQLVLKGSPHWSNGTLQLPGLRYVAGDCTLADAKDARLSNASGRWALDLDTLTVDTACLSKLPSGEIHPPRFRWPISENDPSRSRQYRPFLCHTVAALRR